MVPHSYFILVFNLASLKLISSQQYYDNTYCNSESLVPGSKYLCNSNSTPCQTFMVYRSQQNHQNISSIAALFNLNQTQIMKLNNLTSPSENLDIGRDILLPVNCSCSGPYSQAISFYISSGSEIYSDIACETFEGLSKMQSLMDQNPIPGGQIPAGQKLEVPLKCACPDNQDRINGVKFLVTYPIVKGDDLKLIGSKFNITQEEIWPSNSLGPPDPTIFPQTTVLVPVKNIPVLALIMVPIPAGTSPLPRSVVPLTKVTEKKNTKGFYIGVGVGITAGSILLLLALVTFYVTRKRNRNEILQPSSARSSQLASLSPDLLAGMSKLKSPLFSYSFEALSAATKDFSEASKISNYVYRASIDGFDFVVEQVSSGEARRVTDVLTKINHVNIVRLHGSCLVGGDRSRSLLVFELADNGNLRDCLSNNSKNQELKWRKRMQVAFDIAVGLHYIHHCTSPAYVHRNINSRNIMITEDWRGKISGFGLAKPLPFIFSGSSRSREKSDEKKNNDMIMGRKGYLAPEYLMVGSISPKIDVFAFGVVLLELLSAQEAVNGSLLKDSVGFLMDGGLEASPRCLEKLRSFVDPCLGDEYPLGDALCLALLAKACVDEDPTRRPTMNDVLKGLSRMIS